jgi:hypothetical protein
MNDTDIATAATTDLPALMRTLAAEFVEIVSLSGACALAPPLLPAHTETLNWHNHLFASPLFRRAHVELFEIPAHFAVVHVCIIPHETDPAPIFGFDMIAGRAQATGVFLDFSPVTPFAPVPTLGDVVSQEIRAGFGEPRAPPPWGSIFSEDFLAIRPTGSAEMTRALACARRALGYYLQHLQRGSVARCLVVAGQAAYARAQRQNPHTVRMLSRYIGATAARAFVDDILFPVPDVERL